MKKKTVRTEDETNSEEIEAKRRNNMRKSQRIILEREIHKRLKDYSDEKLEFSKIKTLSNQSEVIKLLEAHLQEISIEPLERAVNEREVTFLRRRLERLRAQLKGKMPSTERNDGAVPSDLNVSDSVSRNALQRESTNSRKEPPCVNPEEILELPSLDICDLHRHKKSYKKSPMCQHNKSVDNINVISEYGEQSLMKKHELNEQQKNKLVFKKLMNQKYYIRRKDYLLMDYVPTVSAALKGKNMDSMLTKSRLRCHRNQSQAEPHNPSSLMLRESERENQSFQIETSLNSSFQQCGIYPSKPSHVALLSLLPPAKPGPSTRDQSVQGTNTSVNPVNFSTETLQSSLSPPRIRINKPQFPPPEKKKYLSKNGNLTKHIKYYNEVVCTRHKPKINENIKLGIEIEKMKHRFHKKVPFNFIPLILSQKL